MTDQPTPPPAPEQPGQVPPSPPPAGGGYAPAPSYQSAPPPAAYGQSAAYAAPAGTLPYVEQYFGPVATFGPRAKAGIIDALVTMIGIIPLLIGMGMLIAGAPTQDPLDPSQTVSGSGSAGLMGTGGIIMLLGFLLIFAIMLWNRVFRMGRTGQSIGKSVAGLKLIDNKTGQPIGPGKSFLRELVHGLANQIFYLSYLWMLWDSNKQTLGDLAVGSTVIKVPKS
jgi:uncharacterized RDD family membrane protein YckC